MSPWTGRPPGLPGPPPAYVDEPDSAPQRVLRWALVLAAAGTVAAVVVPALARALPGGSG